MVVVLPIVVVLFLLAKAFAVIEQQVAEPMSDTLGIRTLLGAGAVTALAILLLLAVCFITGLLMRTPIGARSLAWLEEQVFNRVPGYTLAQAVARGFAQDRAYQVATISLFGPGTSVFGFIMEQHDSGEVTVFVPSAPAATVGLVRARATARRVRLPGAQLHEPVGRRGARDPGRSLSKAAAEGQSTSQRLRLVATLPDGATTSSRSGSCSRSRRSLLL